jgi:hypothetical protein
MLLEAKLSPMNLGDQRFAVEIAESEETMIQGRLSEAIRQPRGITSGLPLHPATIAASTQGGVQWI